MVRVNRQYILLKASAYKAKYSQLFVRAMKFADSSITYVTYLCVIKIMARMYGLFKRPDYCNQ